jgi:hypothetical protein
LVKELQTDLWTLDSVWWGVETAESADAPLSPESDLSAAGRVEGKPEFGLERHLQAFLEDNWEKTLLGKEWGLYEEDGEIVGVEYETGEVGRIDLLARNSKNQKWLVVELKKSQSSDQTLGQVLRYMGWVEENLAQGEVVEGLIIARSADERLRLALKNAKNVTALYRSRRRENRGSFARWESRRFTTGYASRRCSIDWNRSSSRCSMQPTSDIGEGDRRRMPCAKCGRKSRAAGGGSWTPA